MTIHHRLRQQIVSRITVRNPDDVAGFSIQWWAAIERELVPLVGQDGFHALYRRSIALSQARFPWLAPQLGAPSITALGANLAAHTSDDAFEASVELLLIFSKLLAAFIGETLASNIINAAWGEPPLENDDQGEHHG